MSQMNHKLLQTIRLLLTAIITLLCNPISILAQASEQNEEVVKAFSLLEQVKSADKFINTLDSLYTIDLPVGIGAKGNKDQEKYAIIISEIMVEGGNTYLDAYMAFTVPGTTKKVAFKGTKIPFSFNGGIFDIATLYLVSDFDVPISPNVDFVMKGNGKTSVTWDCFGYKEMQLTADILFDSALIVPENPDGTLANRALRSTISTTITDWNDMLVGITLEPFQLKALKGVGFSVTNAVWDMSDFKNPAGIQFGSTHQSTYFIDGNPAIWQGAFLQEAQVRLPPQFRKKNSEELKADSVLASTDSTYKMVDSVYAGRIKFYAKNLLIDELGFTAKLGTSGLMTLDEGDMNGWGFSVENFLIDIEANQLLAGQFSGQIRVPDFQMNEVFDYNAVIGLNGTYAFTAGITETMKLPMWAAQLTLKPNSKITIATREKKFVPALNLNGQLSINAAADKKDTTSAKLALAKMDFEGMKLQTEAPHFSVKQVSFGSEQNKFSKFPVQIRDLGIKNEENKIGLELGMTVNFTKPKSGGFGGEGDFTIWAEKENNHWEYGGVEVDRIAVDISKGEKFYLQGEVTFIRGNQFYGNGFKGAMEAKFGDFELNATTLFGKVGSNRYWFADAGIVLPKPITVGPVGLYSFSGGAYYHVKPTFSTEYPDYEIGRSQSGIKYIPDSTRGLKVKAGTDFGLVGKPETFNGDVCFEIDFTLSGGFRRFAFTGNAYFVTDGFGVSNNKLVEKTKTIMNATNGEIKIPKEEDRSQIYGNIFMEYVHTTKTFHSNFNIYANVAGGLIRGVGKDDKAGWGVMHFSLDDWYIHLGTPTQPNGIKVLGLATLTNYFMAGKSVPELPLPPVEVIEGLKSRNLNFDGLSADSELSSGSGLAFGGNFTFDTGERTFLVFYGRFGCGVGFDILLKDRGHLECKDRPGEKIGINGWYAEGQAYAWVAADIGIKVDLPFYSGKYSILNMNAAALMQAKGPRPFWMKGDVEGDYNILGGLVKGHCDFGFEIGEKCEMVSTSPFGGMEIIADISPSDMESDVSVFTTPQVVFNMPINETIEFEDENHRKKYFRIKLQTLKVSSTNNQAIAGNFNWNDRNDVVAFKPHEVLPGEQNLKILAKVTFEERKGGKWYAIRGEKGFEMKQATFITGKRPPNIPQENIALSYPQLRSFNYYQSISNDNFIQLSSGQGYLFRPGREWVQKVQLTALNTGLKRYVPLSYNESSKSVKFNVPQDLINNTVYRLEIVNIPTAQASFIDENVEQETEAVTIEAEGVTADIEVTTQEAVGAREELQSKSIYSMEFRTSSFNSFADKFNSLQKSEGISWELNPLIHSLTVNIYGERFDNYEVVNLQTGMAISVEPVLGETQWYTNEMLPIIGLTPAQLSSINAEPFKVDPLTTYLFESGGTRRLSDNEAEAGNATDTKVLSGMKYYLAKYVSQYQSYLKGRVANYGGAGASDAQLRKLYHSRFIPLKYGNYPVHIYYTIPGQVKPAQTIKYNINYID